MALKAADRTPYNSGLEPDSTLFFISFRVLSGSKPDSLAVSVIKNKMIMSRIVLISCVSRKVGHKAKAKDLYKGPLFTSSLAFGQSLKPDKIFILSALHHLLDLNKEIEPYNVTLSKIKKNNIKKELKILTPDEKRLCPISS